MWKGKIPTRFFLNSQQLLARLSKLALSLTQGSPAWLSREQVLKARREAEYNPANFGDGRKGRLCICEVPGQVPCPSKVPLQNVQHNWQKHADS